MFKPVPAGRRSRLSKMTPEQQDELKAWISKTLLRTSRRIGGGPKGNTVSTTKAGPA
jgi:hypothetical protein